jgi:hypothetical protein
VLTGSSSRSSPGLASKCDPDLQAGLPVVTEQSHL